MTRRRSESYLPMGYLVVAALIAVLIFPSALRPPPDQQNATASFSPDVPPDDPPELLLQSVRRASSSTAGATAQAAEDLPPEEAPPPPPPPRRAPTRGRCFGDPPRQTESVYSALCVPAWTESDNGGRTAPGVYPDEIRVAIAVGAGNTARKGATIPEGKLSREFEPTDSDDTHHLKVWQAYFNDRFETYGRYIQFYVVRQTAADEDQQRASVAMAKNGYDAFAIFGNGAAAGDEAIRLKMIDFGSVNNPVDFYNDAFPYAYSFYMDFWQPIHMVAELACKQFVGRPPGLINKKRDPTFAYDAPRTWGVIAYQDQTRRGATAMFEREFARCGASFSAKAEYNLTDNQQAISGIAAKMRAAGVTTIVLATDELTPVVFLREAESIGYSPEWIHAGTGGTDTNTAAGRFDDNQARNLIGLSPNEIPRPEADTDWYRAYKEIDPDGEPDQTYFRSLQQFAGGVQHAGPNLTPETFWQGLLKQPYRTPDPAWSIGGGYRQTMEITPLRDLTYMDFMALQWFNPDLGSTNADERYCYIRGGQRYRIGEFPEDPIPWFDPEQCIYEAPAGING